MTTEDLLQPLPSLPISKPADPAVAALKEKYTQEGWTSLMRNQEATNQICVNCKINPPVDPEEEEMSPRPQEPVEPVQQQQEQQEDPQPTADQESLEVLEVLEVLEELEVPGISDMSEIPDMTPESPKSPVPQDLEIAHELPKPIIPAPTSPLPAIPTAAPPSPPSNRVSVLDPMLDAVRKSYRSPSGRLVGGIMAPPPPRAVTTMLPMPPKTPPPIRPPGANVSAPLSPPSSPPAPKIMPRDKRRSPQSSVVVQGNASLPPPPVVPRPRAPSRTALPTPPSSLAITVGPNVLDVTNGQVPMQESTVTDGQGSEVDIAQDHRSEAHRPTRAAENEEKGLESHDEFEDAEEEIKSKEDSTTARESLEFHERVSRLMSQRTVQGWTMLQETCPNPACNGVPLMRSREKKVNCVGCGANYSKTGPSPPTAAKPSEGASRTIRSPSSGPTTSHRITSPLSSPRPMRELHGRISSPIVLPPPTPMSPSFGMTSQQIMSKYHSEDLDKLACDDEEAKRHMQLIGKVGDFATRSLPPVPAMPLTPTSAPPSRPTSTYSNASDKERRFHLPSHFHPQLSIQVRTSENAPPTPTSPRVSASPEVHAMIDATYKTMSTLLSKLEACRLALEVTESPKETHALTNQIKGLMECLKACREVL
ncbi:hypothetical protein BGX31_011109 [Mortierella sp. GBA43]|nr:hypothetical protein BGX31_011109 [Mortierella sp. GBA43]